MEGARESDTKIPLAGEKHITKTTTNKINTAK